MCIKFGHKFGKYVNHNIIHVAEDAMEFQSHLGGLSAYPFENVMGTIFRDVSTLKYST